MLDRNRFVAIVTLVVMAATLSACEPEQGSTKPTKTKAPVAVAPQHAQPTKGSTGNNQPAPVQGDPSAHNTQPGRVGLYVSWESENKTTPLCEWSRNGASQPCANMKVQRDDDGIGYYGFWEHEEDASAGAVYTVTAQGGNSIQYVTCEVSWKGRVHEGAVGSHRCGISYTLE